MKLLISSGGNFIIPPHPLNPWQWSVYKNLHYHNNRFISFPFTHLLQPCIKGALPQLNCLLQHTLRSLCTNSSDSSNALKWIYAVFWRILPRNYPPLNGLWYGGGLFNLAKGYKRNWILVWEIGFYDFYECERSRSEYDVKRKFGADIFFKMSHEVYNVGEGLIGKVASNNSHRWIFRDNPNEKDTSFFSSWNASLEPQLRAWAIPCNLAFRFLEVPSMTRYNCLIIIDFKCFNMERFCIWQTIAIISVREGLIQLGSLDKVTEDLNIVINVQRKFSYLQSIPRIYAIQTPYLPSQHPYGYEQTNLKPLVNETNYGIDDKNQVIRSKRLHFERPDKFPVKSIKLGYNSPQSMAGQPLLSIPLLFPSTPHYANEVNANTLHGGNIKVEAANDDN